MKVKQIPYRADPATAHSLKQYAAERGVSVNALIDEIVQRSLDERATEKFAQWAAAGGAQESAQLWEAQQAVLDAYPADDVGGE